MSTSSLTDFKTVLREFRGMTAWVVAALATPFVVSLAQLSPPWPNGILLISAVVELLCLMLAFQMLRTSSRKRVSRVLLMAVVVFAVVGVFYLLDLSNFTVTGPNDKVIVIGNECTLDAQAVYGKRCPELGLTELAEASFNPEKLWTSRSISFVRTRLVCEWLIAFGALATFMGAFLVFHTKKRRA